ncbi:hypothetical protein HYDPIDRAFT_91894 [Hydnomerulius pinastri MD-312]|uniref:Cytochrome P450 n=1 Tax=Hydnomerulius pinastri MD-312 TaxID=994086 RepID=A0A0C9W8J6_9AGAM|nr:hypothetical protein HYDPIDRAFT_91894 [Hydnomerulius pinastri MD-312]
MAAIAPFTLERTALWCAGAALGAVWAVYRLFTPPRSIRHLPRVPILPLLRSYFLREPNDVQFQRLIMPFVNEKSEGVVVVWAMGKWMIHILDPKLFAQVSSAIHDFPKEQAAKESMFNRFLGSTNVVLANGEDWKKQSALVREGFARPLPIDLFTTLAKNTFEVIESTTSPGVPTCFTVRWSELAQNFALDAVGISVIGHNYNAIRARSPFVVDYNQMTHDMAEPLYLVFPILEKMFPRQKVISRMDRLFRGFEQLLEAKRSDPGEDIMTSLLSDPELSQANLRDNMAALFMAGQDTTSGAMASLMYHLAINPRIQSNAREEVLRVIGPTADPSIGLMNPQSLPYLSACIREALRINPPGAILAPRISQANFTLGQYFIPAGFQLACNVYAVHRSKSSWGDPEVFRPERFLDGSKSGGGRESWVPFSVGPRQCPAFNFALYELRTLAVMMLRRYEWKLPEGSIHADRLVNAFSAFSLTLPLDLDITFMLRE